MPAAAGLDAEKIKDVDEDEFGAKVRFSQLGFESSILQKIINIRNLCRDVEKRTFFYFSKPGTKHFILSAWHLVLYWSVFPPAA